MDQAKAEYNNSLVDHGSSKWKRLMHNPTIVVPLVLLMVAIIVGVDLVFFRSRTWFWERLAANVGIVLVFGAFYFRFQ
jgi:hypothetical protein